MNSDISSAINYMKSNYNIADGEIGITGHSMGGRLAAINSNKAKALALWAPANGEGSNACDFLSRGSFVLLQVQALEARWNQVLQTLIYHHFQDHY